MKTATWKGQNIKNISREELQKAYLYVVKENKKQQQEITKWMGKAF